MATPREIRRRIKSIKNIAQVTRALEAVSASKVRRAQAQVLATRPYAQKSWQVLTNLASQTAAGALLHPLLARRPESKTIGIVLLTSDRGLCGAFNYNMVRTTMDFVESRGKPTQLFTVGRKGRDLMWRSKYTIVAEFSRLPPNPTVLDITPIARTAIDDFMRGAVDEVYLAYTDFIHTLKQVPAVKRLLPIQPGEPGLGRFLIMRPVYPPVRLHSKMILKMIEQIIGRHQALCEEMATHPVLLSFLFKDIRELAMGKYVDKELSV